MRDAMAINTLDRIASIEANMTKRKIVIPLKTHNVGRLLNATALSYTFNMKKAGTSISTFATNEKAPTARKERLHTENVSMSLKLFVSTEVPER